MPEMSNRLAGETSPYLRQHAHNPVAWQPWDAEALAQARREDLPILLSIGYSACHWCHVMAHESFEDAGVAAVMNRLFVNIKVDREERPDLDQIYQTAHQMLTGRPGGWPLTLFLAPDGTPFYGGTYFPKEARYGLPGFAGLCEQVGLAWREKRAAVEAQNREVLAALARPASEPDADGIDAAPVKALRVLLLGSFDREAGGFGGAPKFPHPADLAFLLRRTDDPPAREAALFTLERMAAGGIHDQIGGGFCRYSVDERWEIPHFEKMLYDNGPLLGLYADAWALTGAARHREVAEGIAGWLMREMTGPEGAFYAALDADSEGEEGRFYVWDRAEIASLLTPQESVLAGRCLGVDGPPNFENRHWHLRRAAEPVGGEAVLLESARAKLFAARERRVRPARDDKILTAWNALMIEGLAHASRVFGRGDWLAAARRALDFLKNQRWRDGALFATDRLSAYLDDHAFLLAALLELLQAGYRPADLAFAREIAEAMLGRFGDAERGGFFFTAHDHEALIQRPKSGHDNAMPAGNGVAALVLQRLGHLLGEPRYLEAARRAIECFMPQLRRQVAGMATLAGALEEALAPAAIVILRGPAEEMPAWRPLLAARRDVMAIELPNGSGPAELPDMLAKPESAHVNAWVCRGVSCLRPMANVSELAEVLQAS
ncbi:MAG: thioredoxin domain-containing protein [Pseudomonadota bacterium]